MLWSSAEEDGAYYASRSLKKLWGTFEECPTTLTLY